MKSHLGQSNVLDEPRLLFFSKHFPHVLEVYDSSTIITKRKSPNVYKPSTVKTGDAGWCELPMDEDKIECYAIEKGYKVSPQVGESILRLREHLELFCGMEKSM